VDGAGAGATGNRASRPGGILAVHSALAHILNVVYPYGRMAEGHLRNGPP